MLRKVMFYAYLENEDPEVAEDSAFNYYGEDGFFVDDRFINESDERGDCLERAQVGSSHKEKDDDSSVGRLSLSDEANDFNENVS